MNMQDQWSVQKNFAKPLKNIIQLINFFPSINSTHIKAGRQANKMQIIQNRKITKVLNQY